MSFRARYTIIVAEQPDGDYKATERGVDVEGRGPTPPAAIADYAQSFVEDTPEVAADD